MHVGPTRGDDRGKPYTEPDFPTSDWPQNSGGHEVSRPGLWERFSGAALRLLEQILFEPQSTVQKEQLARKILDHSRMSRRGFESALINVSEMADRFRESRRNVRQSLALLEQNGTVERTQSRDHWKLTIRVSSPVRAVYDPPRVSAPFPQMPPNPPPGWIELQNRAHKAKDSKEFNEIIDEMNRLLSSHEKAAAEENDPNPFPARECDNPVSNPDPK